MKIVFIGGRDIHILGGIENYMLNLTRELTLMGHECIVWCESDHNEVKMLDGVKVIYHPGPKSNLLCKPWSGLKATQRTMIDEKGVTAIHYNAWPPSLWCWLPRIAGIPSLLEGHGLEWQRSKYSPRAQRIMRFMERVTAKMNQHLIMCSEGQVEYFKKEYGRESVCIPGAVNLPNLQADNDSDILNRFGLTPRKFFLFMGRIVQDKNPDYLIKAFIACEHSGYKLVVAGGNDAMPDYVEGLHSLANDCPEVVFTGPVYGKDKEQLLRNAYSFCLPSTIEGLSIVLLEAASYKLPIIASDIDANKEFLGEDAVFVKPENVEQLKDALEFAICNPVQMQRFVDINYEKILNKYTWDKVAAKYVSYIEKISKKK